MAVTTDSEAEAVPSKGVGSETISELLSKLRVQQHRISHPQSQGKRKRVNGRQIGGVTKLATT